MTAAEKRVTRNRVSEQLATSGFRFTRQRQQVYDVLLLRRDHPTAEEVFLRAKHRTPEISLATVYNCLDALVRSGLVKQVHLDRGASRYCPNMHEHCHFHCEQCGGIFDIDLEPSAMQVPMPRGFKASHLDMSIRGLCPDCGGSRKN
jgi:Fur family peroxide stress response transcriptional regulator